MIRRSIGLAGVLLSLSPPAAASSPSNAAGPQVRLDYRRAPGAETCPDEASFRQVVAAQTQGGLDPFSPNASAVLRVTFEPAPPGRGFRGTLELLDRNGQPAGADRKEEPTCAAAARALALSVSVLFLAPPQAVQPPVPASSPAAGSAAPSLPVPPPVSRPLPAVRVQIGAGALVGFGFGPNPSPGFGAFIGLRFPRSLPAFGLFVEGRGDFDSSGDVVALPDAAAKASAGFAGGSVAPCGYMRWFFGCGLFTAGVVRGSAGEGYEPAQQASLFAGLGGRVGAELWLVEGRPSFGLRFAMDGLFLLSRPSVIAGADRIWQAPLGAGAASAHLVALF